MIPVTIKTEWITLSALLKYSGAVSTGGEAKQCIHLGEVRVNSCVCALPGKKLRPGDTVAFGGRHYEVVGACI